MEKAPSFSFQVDGQAYSLDYGKMTGRDLMDFQNAVGMPLTQAAAGGIEPLVLVAAIKWLQDRRSDKKVSFDSVLETITYEQVSFEDVEVEPDPPTQEGGSGSTSPPSPPSMESNPGNSNSSESKSLTSTSPS